MREILFKGKRKDNGEWVYGYIHKYDNAEQRGNVYIIPSHASVFYSHEVLTETVCQYTGLKDKNGMKIFEGDIVEFIFEPKTLNMLLTGKIVFDEYFNSVIFVKDKKGCVINYFHIENAKNGSVIGNIFDNPELLEEK